MDQVLIDLAIVCIYIWEGKFERNKETWFCFDRNPFYWHSCR